MAQVATGPSKGSLGIYNIGKLITGDLRHPIANATALLIEGGVITAIGDPEILSGARVDHTIDARGLTAAPGLIDNHVHPVIGDWTPRQRMLDFIESSLHGGVTSMISAGEVHTPGRPRDPVGAKAMAILAAKTFHNAPPGGVKVHAGAVMIEQGMTEKDFAEMAEGGVKLVGEIGLSSVPPEAAAPYVRWAQAHGMKCTIHTGGSSIPGSTVVGADHVLTCGADVAAHINGGPTGMSPADIQKLVREANVALEIVQCGNQRNVLIAMEDALAHGALHRVVVGTDMPSGTGVIPLGILRTLAHVASMTEVAPEVAWALATGNTARLHGLNTGVLETGREGDVLLIDAPYGCIADDAMGALAIGDVPALAVAVIDGVVRVKGSRNTPPARQMPAVH